MRFEYRGEYRGEYRREWQARGSNVTVVPLIWTLKITRVPTANLRVGLSCKAHREAEIHILG